MKKRLVDIAMAIILLLLMAYELIGEATHEYLGIAMLILLCAHHVLNRTWHTHLFKGRYGLNRSVMALVDVLLFVMLIAQMVSGIMMARHVLDFLPHAGRRSVARSVHLALAYWSFALMGLHVGLHMRPLAVKMGRLLPGKRIWAARVALAAIGVYGAYAAISRQLPGYMLLQIQFAFFDFEEPLIFFFADYLAIMVLFVLAGYGLNRGMTMKRRAKIPS